MILLFGHPAQIQLARGVRRVIMTSIVLVHCRGKAPLLAYEGSTRPLVKNK